MLRRLEIDGMRLWQGLQLDLEEKVPLVLIGPNASGKTTVLEALDFLAVAASKGLSHAVYTQHQGPGEFFRAGATQLRLSVLFDGVGAFEKDGGPVSYTLVLRRVGAVVTVAEETIEVFKKGLDQRPLPAVSRREGRCQLLNFRTNEEEEVKAPDVELLLEAVRDPERFPTLVHVRQALASMRVHPSFATVPRWAADPREAQLSPRASQTIRPQPQLDPRGLDLINALYTLKEGDDRRWAYLLNQLRQEFPNLEKLSFPADPGGSRIGLTWTDRRFPGATFGAEQMSEGLWSYLTLLAAIVPAEPGAVVAFDEPDAHLHPSALRGLVSLLEQLAETTTVIVTSHSTGILDHLADPLRSLRVAQPTPTGSSLGTLDAEALNAWLADYQHPSVLRRMGLLDPSNQDGREPE